MFSILQNLLDDSINMPGGSLCTVKMPVITARMSFGREWRRALSRGATSGFSEFLHGCSPHKHAPRLPGPTPLSVGGDAATHA